MADQTWTEYWETLTPVRKVWHWEYEWFEGSTLNGLCFFCMDCGAIWGRKWATPPDGTMPRHWLPMSQSCLAHGGGSFNASLTEFSCFVASERRERRAPREALLNEFLAATRPQHDNVLPATT